MLKKKGRGSYYRKFLLNAYNAKTSNNKRRFPKIEMLSTAHGEMVGDRSYLPGLSPKNNDNNKSCVVKIIGPVVERDANGNHRLRVFNKKPQEKTDTLHVGKTKNGHSILLKLTYNKVNILFGGDLNTPAEMFLLNHYTGLDVYNEGQVKTKDIIEKGRNVFGVDIAKACHHGSADFSDIFLACINPVATNLQYRTLS